MQTSEYDGTSDAAGAAVAAPFMCLWGGMSCGMVFVWGAMMIVGIVGAILWIIMLIDVIRREEGDFPSKSDNQKTLWLLIVLLGGWIGGVVYYFTVYKKMGGAK